MDVLVKFEYFIVFLRCLFSKIVCAHARSEISNIAIENVR